MRKGKVKLPPSESEDAIGVAHESENGIALSVMRRPTEKYIRHYSFLSTLGSIHLAIIKL
jgi:hypothetical protein